MNWEAIEAIGEVVGAVVVVVSLVYLAAQVRQNTEQARLSSVQAVNASNDSAFNPIYIPENTRIWTKGHANPASLDPHESQVFHMLMTRLLASFDATTYQAKHGSFEPRALRRHGSVLRVLHLHAGGLEVVRGARSHLSSRHSGEPGEGSRLAFCRRRLKRCDRELLLRGQTDRLVAGK